MSIAPRRSAESFAGLPTLARTSPVPLSITTIAPDTAAPCRSTRSARSASSAA